jgi:hypothetical protein
VKNRLGDLLAYTSESSQLDEIQDGLKELKV